MLIVDLSEFLVLQHVISIGDFGEHLGGIGLLGDIRMVLSRELIIGLFDVLLRGAFWDVQSLVEILCVLYEKAPKKN